MLLVPVYVGPSDCLVVHLFVCFSYYVVSQKLETS